MLRFDIVKGKSGYHVVTTDEEGKRRCSCLGFGFRKKCSHLKEISKSGEEEGVATKKEKDGEVFVLTWKVGICSNCGHSSEIHQNGEDCAFIDGDLIDCFCKKLSLEG